MKLSDELRLRTKAFASEVVRLFIRLPKKREEMAVLGKQMLRSGTSVAAHAREASRARSDAEFCSKLDGLLQEADETQLWIELLSEDCGLEDPRLRFLHTESNDSLRSSRLSSPKSAAACSTLSAFQPFSLSAFPVFPPFSFSVFQTAG